MKTMESLPGDEIKSTIHKAIEEAKANDCVVSFKFNGVDVLVAADSIEELIFRDWERAISGYLGKNAVVGPYPPAELSYAQIESDAEIKEENIRKSAERQQQYAKESKAKTEELNRILELAGPIEINDEPAWNKFREVNQDPYGAAVVRYAENWARLMQHRIASGAMITQCAEETSRLADSEGITGFMYGAAVSVLSHCWKHGEALRRWHNKETQIGDEGDRANKNGGVLNPAIITIG